MAEGARDMVDGAAGFGNTVNIGRAVQAHVQAGAAAIRWAGGCHPGGG